jgi:hypothetical protein
VWCPECYTPPADVRFHHAKPQDEGGFEYAHPKDALRHACGREGDHLVTPFQCDTCVFRNIKNRNPGSGDRLLLACIRQVNLDALWGRESATVSSTFRAARQTIKILSQVSVPPPFPPLGPFPVDDRFGYAVAIAMVLKSREAGRYADYQQYETIRKLRAGYSNIYQASLLGMSHLKIMGGDKAKQCLSDCPTNSLWFERFSRGCLSRMGQIVKQDRAVSLPLMHALCSGLEEEWERAETLSQRSAVASVGALTVTCFCGSFRGPEMTLVDLFGLAKYIETDRFADGREFVIIPLLGRFKNEIGDQYHLTPLAAVTKSGLQVKRWIKRLVDVRKQEHRDRGPAFGSRDGNNLYSWYEREILDRFLRIQLQDPDIIPAEVQVLEEYGLSRSFRRGATSEARARGIDPTDIDLTNRWRTFEEAKGRRPRMTMRDHYSDIRLLVPALIKFSEGL